MNETVETTNPLLTKAKMPGQTFSLPSQALFYKDEVSESVIASNGEFIMYPMVTLDEISMKTPDQLLNGTALVNVLKRCAPDILDPLRMFSKDIDYILICMRRLTYGAEYSFGYMHSCEEAKDHNYTVDLDSLITRVNKITKKEMDHNYLLTLENQQSIKFIPPRYKEMLDFYDSYNDEDMDPNKVTETVLKTLSSMIENVDGITDKSMIYEWIQTISAGYITKISDKISELGKWGPDLSTEIECRDCNEKVDIEISLNPISFFS